MVPCTLLVAVFYKKMSFKIREEHVNMIADFMEEHLELARERLSCANAREEFRKLWAELANNLNSLGFGIRSIEKWQRTWSDYKLNLKKRASELKKEYNKTGGGLQSVKTLRDTDTRLLNIMGKIFVEGCGTEEIEFEIFHKILEKREGKNTASTHSLVVPSAKPTSNIIQDCQEKVLPPVASTSTNMRQYCQEKRTAPEDHDYLATPLSQRGKKRMKSGQSPVLNSYYEETIQLLAKIEKNTKSVSDGLNTINHTIDATFSELCGILNKNNNCT